jgi:hypothetical protein
LDYVNQTYQSKVFLLTEGNLFSKNGLYLKEEAEEIQPFQWFELEDRARFDLEMRKVEKLGPRPESYSLTKEELETLSYEEQKKKAYSLKEIAVKRCDNRGFTNWIYTSGIKAQAPFKEKDYIQVDEKIARVRFIRFVEDRENKTFKEEASIAIKNESGAAIEFIHDLNRFHSIPEETVPEEWKVSAN